MSSSLSRRQFLRGTLASAAVWRVGLPTLESMLNTNGTAYADGRALPQRFGVFFFASGRGIDATQWNPKGVGRAWKPSPILAPLANFKDYISVVSGMQAKLDKGVRGHHNGTAAILSGYDYLEQSPTSAPYRSTFAQPSIDQRVAAVAGKETPFRSLDLGISSMRSTSEGSTLKYLSHNGPDNVNPAEVDPRRVFQRLFVQSLTDHSEAGKRLAQIDRSILDYVLDDLQALSKRVSQADRKRLDQHFENIRAIEKRIESQSIRLAECQVPARPGSTRSPHGEPLAERLDVMGDLLCAALACDMTRVFSIQYTCSSGSTVFWQVGTDRGHHELSHGGAATQQTMQRICVFTMEQLAVLLAKLKATADGAGNLLDSLAMLVTSDHSDGATHSVEDFPVLAVGRASGKLVHPGVHYASKGEHTNRVLLSLLRVSGVEIDSLGEGGAFTREGCSTLEAA